MMIMIKLIELVLASGGGKLKKTVKLLITTKLSSQNINLNLCMHGFNNNIANTGWRPYIDISRFL